MTDLEALVFKRQRQLGNPEYIQEKAGTACAYYLARVGAFSPAV